MANENNKPPEDEDFAAASDYAPPQEGRDGPPDGWTRPSWFNRETLEWWWNGRPDPCPAEPLGHVDGEYVFRTGAGEVRRFTSGNLHSSGGPTDLFGGEMWWPYRHFRKWDPEKKEHTGNFQKLSCMAAMVRACILAGYYDNAAPCRGVGIWRGPDNLPVVHAGDVIFFEQAVFRPGNLIGESRYVVGGARDTPAYEMVGRRDFRWLPSPIDDAHKAVGHINEWHWQDDEGRDLFIGGLFCDMLGDALLWKPHRFIRAVAGSGKTTLLKYVRALLGGAAHPIQRTYSKARLEQKFSHTSCALLLEEAESDTEAERMRKVLELLLLLSDEGATGGRGSSGGQSRDIDLHGAVTMVATLTEDWRTTLRSRVAYIELRPLRDRGKDHPVISPEGMAALIEEAGRLSPGLRARALVMFGRFQENLKLVRARILELGGSPRDADQLGHLIAGWACMTSDEILNADELRELDRFKPYIMTVVDEEDGAGDPSELLNTLLGLPASGLFKGGQQLTIGQVIARAREPDSGADMRSALLPFGLRLERVQSEVTGRLEPWNEAWLAVANKHPALDKLFGDYPEYRGNKRRQILSDLRRMVDGVLHHPQATDRPLRFAGPQARALLLPPVFLPSLADEKQEDPPAQADRVDM